MPSCPWRTRPTTIASDVAFDALTSAAKIGKRRTRRSKPERMGHDEAIPTIPVNSSGFDHQRMRSDSVGGAPVAKNPDELAVGADKLVGILADEHLYQ